MKAEPYYEDYYWLEFIERELDPGLRKDLHVLLKNSRADREIYESLETIRMIVKATDDVPMPENGMYYDRLHARIMRSIEAKTQLETVVRQLSKKLSPDLKGLQETETR